MADDNLIKPVDGQSIFSIQSAKDKDLNEKKKRQNSGESQPEADEEIGEVDKSDNEISNDGGKGKHIIDFCA